MKAVLKLKYSRGEYYLLADYNTKNDYDDTIKKGTVFYKDDVDDIIRAEYSPASKVSRRVIASTIFLLKNEVHGDGINNHYYEEEIPSLSLNNIETLLNLLDSKLVNGQSEWYAEIDMVLVEPNPKSTTQFESFYTMKKENDCIVINKIV